MTKDKGYELARCASIKSDFGRCRTGAIAIYRNNLIAEGWNSEKTSPLQAHYNKKRGFDGYTTPSCLHAEMMVISKIKNLDIYFPDVIIFVWRGNSKENVRLSRPCAACEAAIRELGITKIYYTGNKSFIREIYNKEK